MGHTKRYPTYAFPLHITATCNEYLQQGKHKIPAEQEKKRKNKLRHWYRKFLNLSLKDWRDEAIATTCGCSLNKKNKEKTDWDTDTGSFST